jgi:lipopolysaccharide export system protein LptA
MNMGLAVLCVVLAALGAPCLAAPASAPPSSGTQAPVFRGLSADQPIDIGADAASLRERDRVVVLSGNVVAKQGTIELKADKVTVYYAPGGAPKAGTGVAGQIDRLVAEGNVVVTRPGEIVKSAAATYEMAARQIVMSGHVVAMKDGNVVRGERVVVDLANETMRLDMGAPGGRVRGVFVPPTPSKKP